MKKCPCKTKKNKKILFFVIFCIILIFGLSAFCDKSSLNLAFYEKKDGVFYKNNEENHDVIFKEVNLFIADTPNKRLRGLMFVKKLDENKGMIFIFDREDDLRFWMKNTFIPLDLVFLDKNFNIIGIVKNATPLYDKKLENIPTYGVKGKSKYVIELNAFFTDKYNIHVGDKFRFKE